MFALSTAVGRQLGADGAPGFIVRWRRGTAPFRPDMADLKAAGAGRVILDMGDGPLDDDAIALAAQAGRAGLTAEIVAGAAAGWSADSARRLHDGGLTQAMVRVAPDPWTPRAPRGWDPAAKAARAIDGAMQGGLAVGVAFRLTQDSTGHLCSILNWVERSDASGCDVAHVIPDGRLDWHGQMARPAQTRFALRELTAAAWRWRQRWRHGRIRTWYGPADPIFVYIWCLRHAPTQAGAALAAAKAKAAAWPDLAWLDGMGNVSAVASMPVLTLGRVGPRPFSDIWLDREQPGWERTRALYDAVGVPCVTCRWHSLCGGGERGRAMTSDALSGPDPACYLTGREKAAAGPLESSL